ncbi:MAG TPA: hypothetical protein VGM86_30340 [Thermoanaerobaculia bacterium]|jgi:hypothetical protein
MSTIADKASTLMEEIKNLRKKKVLHRRVCSALAEAIRELFPDWVYVSEIGQTPGGRNDAILFESGGDSICFELFASLGQVDRDLLLLRESPAKAKVAILLDREIDPSIAEAYYRKLPHKPYPCIWASDILDPSLRGVLKVKLAQHVFRNDIARAFALSHQLQRTSQQRTLEAWREKGIDIYTGTAGQASTFPGIMSLLAVNRMRKMGVALPSCEEAARMICENFDFLVKQILYGVPMLLTWDGEHCSIMDLSDYECWLLSAVPYGEADQVVVLVNNIYSDMRKMHLGDLPEPGDMNRIIKIMVEGRRLFAILEAKGEIPMMQPNPGTDSG